MMVPVDLFVMSKCPDAVFAEKFLVDALSPIQSIVNISLNYIATPDTTEPLFKARCMHGVSECQGNIQQWLPFVLCENQQYRSIPDERLARKCATETNISYDLNEFQDCLIGQEGVQLLQDSISVTQSAGATKSCTIHVNGKPRCIRDGGQFYNCPGGSSPSDFVATVCEAYNQLFAVGAASGATKTAPDACGLESSSPRRSGESDTFEGFLNLLVFQK